MKIFSILIAGILLASCQRALIYEQNNYVAFGQNSWLQLHQDVTIPANEARIFFEQGKIMNYDLLSLYRVTCELTVRQVKEITQTIKPDRFKVVSISQQLSPIVQTVPYQVASLHMLANSNETDIKRYWKFGLNSSEQPDVLSLICRGVQDTHEMAQLPTVEEINQTLGEIITTHFNLAELTGK